MYIITARHGVFNTDCIPAINTNQVEVYARIGNANITISYDPIDYAKIIEALKNGESCVELGG